MGAVPGDQAGQLLTGEAGDLDQITSHHPLVGSIQARIVHTPEGIGDEGISLFTVWDVKVEGLAAVQESTDLIQGGYV